MALKGKVLLTTNRDVHPGNNNLTLFGDRLDRRNSAELNVATFSWP